MTILTPQSVREINRILMISESAISQITGMPTEIHAKIGSEDIKANKALSPFNLDALRRIVCLFYGVKPADFISKSRKRELVIARQSFCWLALYYHFGPLVAIGRYIGGRDHTTVLHGRQTISDLIYTDKNFERQFKTLAERADLEYQAESKPKQDATPGEYLEQYETMTGGRK